MALEQIGIGQAAEVLGVAGLFFGQSLESLDGTSVGFDGGRRIPEGPLNQPDLEVRLPSERRRAERPQFFSAN